MGFCVFNSIAIAAHQALAMGLERVLILDWDVHHGNGTQEIFYEDARVLFVDLHQEDLFPKYSGRSEEIGTGKGEGFTLNLPLPHSSTQEDYLAVLERVVKPRVFAFRPQLILISAGFDADISDPMGSMSLTWEGYRKMTQTAVAWADELCGGKVLMVLEGGYEPQALARNVYECAQVLAESSRGEDFLASVPDWSDGSQVESWLLETRTRVGQLTREPLPESAVFYMGAPGGEGGASLGPLGGYASERWRKWVLCLYAADLLSYPLARDQVEFDRLAFLVSRFPQGFQLVLVRAGECWLPVGYTGWYPMGPSAFDAFEKNPGALTSRMVVPEQSAYLYLFNFSVAPLFKKTSLSMQMMQNYAQTIRSRNPMGLAAITVSQEGRRVVERFGLSPRGELRTSSSVESVYIWRGGGK
jgi:hypothetical protein